MMENGTLPKPKALCEFVVYVVVTVAIIFAIGWIFGAFQGKCKVNEEWELMLSRKGLAHYEPDTTGHPKFVLNEAK
jgi:hypothetical protein